MKKYKRIESFVFILFISSFICFGQSLDHYLDEQINKIFSGAKIPGFAAAVVDQDRILYQKGFGFADIEKKVPYTTETIQNIASVSKTLISIALMKAEEKNIVRMDTPINKYLAFKVIHPIYPEVPITLWHLATHTSGIKDIDLLYNKYAYSQGKVPEMKLGTYLKQCLSEGGEWYSKKNFGEHSPGEEYSYSNVGAALAAYVLECAAGIPFSEYTEKYILEPLSLKNSGWYYQDVKDGIHASLYDSDLKPIDPYTLITYPDGGFRTSCLGLAKVLMAVLNEGKIGDKQILEEGSVQKMLTPQFDPEKIPLGFKSDGKNIGIFWDIQKNGIIGHTGGDPGVTTLIFFDPELKIGSIFMTNVSISKENSSQIVGLFRLLCDFETLSEAAVK